jgi:hypothetical protein
LSTKSAAGRPARVSAAHALAAYGTPTTSVRGPSVSPATATPSQRAPVSANSAAGSPLSRVAPNANGPATAANPLTGRFVLYPRKLA